MFIAWTTKLKWTISAKAHLRQLTFQLFFFFAVSLFNSATPAGRFSAISFLFLCAQ